MVNGRFTLYAGRVMLQDATESTRSEAQKEHDDRGEVDHEECLKHTKKAILPEKDEG